jgi:hypothetical protein
MILNAAKYPVDANKIINANARMENNKIILRLEFRNNLLTVPILDLPLIIRVELYR